MSKSGRTLHELKSKMQKYPQKLLNIRLKSKVDLSMYPELSAVVQEVESELGESGRVLLRPSGTEPIIRVMVEGEDESMVLELVASLADRVESVLQKHV